MKILIKRRIYIPSSLSLFLSLSLALSSSSHNDEICYLLSFPHLPAVHVIGENWRNWGWLRRVGTGPVAKWATRRTFSSSRHRLAGSYRYFFSALFFCFFLLFPFFCMLKESSSFYLIFIWKMCVRMRKKDSLKIWIDTLVFGLSGERGNTFSIRFALEILAKLLRGAHCKNKKWKYRRILMKKGTFHEKLASALEKGGHTIALFNASQVSRWVHPKPSSIKYENKQNWNTD